MRLPYQFFHEVATSSVSSTPGRGAGGEDASLGSEAGRYIRPFSADDEPAPRGELAQLRFDFESEMAGLEAV
jgi:hypothetical protein